jgi:hypothetical protein
MIKRVLVAFAALALAGSAASAAGVNGATLSKDKRTTSVPVGSGHFSPTALPKKTAIFSNVGVAYPKGLYFCCYGSTISGPNAGVGGTYSVALQFTPASDVNAKEIDAGVGLVQGVNAVDLAIYDDAGGVPGNLIDSGKATGLGTFGDCCTMAVAKVKASLKGGTPYWMVVSADKDGANTWAAWAFNSTDEIDIVTAAYNGGSGWSPSGAVPAPSFQVIGK